MSGDDERGDRRERNMRNCEEDMRYFIEVWSDAEEDVAKIGEI